MRTSSPRAKVFTSVVRTEVQLRAAITTVVIGSLAPRGGLKFVVIALLRAIERDFIEEGARAEGRVRQSETASAGAGLRERASVGGNDFVVG